MTDTYYQADPITGRYVGIAEVQPSPLEEGVLLVPAGAYADPPPAAQDGYIVQRSANGKAWQQVEIPSESYAQAATDMQGELLAAAFAKVTPLQYAVDLKIATEAETAALQAWKEYSVKLMRIDSQKGYPKAIDWPSVPV